MCPESTIRTFAERHAFTHAPYRYSSRMMPASWYAPPAGSGSSSDGSVAFALIGSTVVRPVGRVSIVHTHEDELTLNVNWGSQRNPSADRLVAWIIA